MATYTKTVWEDLPSTNTPLNASNLNKIEDAIESLYNMMYPVGSIYMSVNSSNPSTYFGGTWVAWGSGRVPVGVNANDTSFNTVEKTGGEKTHTLTTAEMPKHTHTFTGTKHHHTYDKVKSPTGGPSTNTSGSTTLTIDQIPSHSHNTTISGQSTSNYIMGAYPYKDGVGAGAKTGAGSDWYWNKGVPAQGGGKGHTHTLNNHTHTTSTSSTSTGETTAGGTNSETGSGNAHNILQPYITCYMWKRTA